MQLEHFRGAAVKLRQILDDFFFWLIFSFKS